MSENKTAMVMQSSGPDRFALEPRNFAEGMQMARIVAHTGLYGVKTPEDAFVRMATGMALGLSAPQSLRGLFVISGKVGIGADLMMGLALRHPECRYFRCVETTAERATFTTQRGDDPETALSFTMEDAKRAGLNSNAMYGKYPAQMLRARCIAGLARLVYPEVMHGLYVPEELEKATKEAEDAGREMVGSVVEAEPPPADLRPPPAKPSGPDAAIRALVAAAQNATTLQQAESAHAALASAPPRARAEGWFALARFVPVEVLPMVREKAVADITAAQFAADLDRLIKTRTVSEEPQGDTGDDAGAAA